MLGFGRKKNLPDPSTNTKYSPTQNYLAQAMGASPTQETEKKKKMKLDPGGQPYRGSDRMA